MIDGLIELVLSNPSVTCLVLGLLCSLIVMARQPKPLQKPRIVEALFSYFLLWSIGIYFLYNFIIHTIYAEMAASFIGWENSPFQYEVGFACLGFGVVGVIAFWGTFEFRAASVIGPGLFQWGAAGGHIYQMVTMHNFAPGNAGVVFWADIFLPILGLALLYQQFTLKRVVGR